MFQNSSLVILALTQQCNMHCKYCYLGDKSSLPDTQMNFDTFKMIMNQVKKDFIIYNRTRPIQILFHGGEPTLLPIPVFEQMLDYGTNLSKEFNLPVNFAIQTNGINLNSDYIALFKKYNVAIGFSFDGVLNNDRLTSVNSKKIVENFNNAVKETGTVGTVSVITNNNIDTILDEIKKFPKLRVVKLNYEEDIDKDAHFSPSAQEYFTKILQKDLDNFIYFKNPSQLHPNLYTHASRLIPKYIIDMLAFTTSQCKSTCSFKFCGAGVTLLCFLPDGTLHLCDRWRGDEDFFNEKIIHISDYDFLSLSQYMKLLEFLEFMNPMYSERGCDSCVYADVCSFPCTTISYKREGRPFISEETCKLTKLTYNYIWEHLGEFLEYFYEKKEKIVYTHELIPVQLKYLSFEGFNFEIDPEIRGIRLYKGRER